VKQPEKLKAIILDVTGIGDTFAASAEGQNISTE
jgi:hypothetical protein